jgi:hypothetical protein
MLGLTPVQTSSRSAAIVLPSASVARQPSPRRSTLARDCPSTMRTPLRAKLRSMIAEARGSKYPDSTCGCSSTTVTATPALAMFSAACMPIRPAPSTIADGLCPIACRRSTASSIDRST